MMNIGGMRTLDSQIGVLMDDTFFISEGCLGKCFNSVNSFFPSREISHIFLWEA